MRACLDEDAFDVMEFDSVDTTAAALETHTPGLIFLGLELGNSDAIEALRVLAEQNRAGILQLMSGRRGGERVLEPSFRAGDWAATVDAAVLAA